MSSTSEILDQVTAYVRDNPGVVAAACLTVLLIGLTQIILRPSSASSSSTSDNSGSGSSDSVLTTDYASYPLLEKRDVSHNTRVFRFGYREGMSPSLPFGLPLGRHISLRAPIGGNEVRRPYTPISTLDTRGYFELLVKVYPSPHGMMSRHLDSLVPGRDSVEVRGPLGKFAYTRNQCKRLLMVCGGTGITPMWQVLITLLNDPADRTKITVVFANVSYDDILLKDELDELAETFAARFSVYYVLNDAPDDMEWDGGVGFVSRKILDEQFGPPADGSKVLMCGPPPMNKAMKTILAEMGYTDAQQFKF